MTYSFFEKLHIPPSIKVYHFESIDSTNNFAKTLTDDSALVIADFQTMGKGRLGRSFYSSKGEGLYFSLKLPVPDLYENVPFITTLSSVAVSKAIEKLYNIRCSIKWVNDIYLDGKKVSGILCEATDENHAIIGIGVNFSVSSFPDQIEDIATSLPTSSVTKELLLSEIANNLLNLVSHLPDTAFLEYYKSRSYVLGKKILCITENEEFEAEAIDIDPRGGLIVNLNGSLKTLSSSLISIRVMN